MNVLGLNLSGFSISLFGLLTTLTIKERKTPIKQMPP